MSDEKDKLLAAAIAKLEAIRRAEAFDPAHLDSRPTPKQQEVFSDFGSFSQQWVRAGNQSGKSATCAKIVGGVATETDPVVAKRRADPNPKTSWGSEPLLIIVAGRTGKQIEDSLLPKIRSYLRPGTYKEVRIGNIIQRLEIANGNRIVFQSLENPNVARERLMSYVAHVTWCDELPPTMDLVRELQIRTQARNGYALWSFTPTVVNVEIQRYVDSLKEPEAKIYRFHMLDNPLYSDPERREELLSKYKHLPDHVQRAIFEGEWLSSDDQVYYFNWNTMVEMPNNYSPLWRHVEAVDPALKSALGLTVWAEDPITDKWYCVLSEYVKGIYIPTELVRVVNERVKHLNIVKRIADPHEVWYIQTASSMGIHYAGVYKKNERKGELIKRLQESLGEKIRIAPNCQDLIAELQECRWSSAAEGKIVNASSYHLLDSAQYFADQIPKPEKKIISSTWDEWLYKANEDRKVNVEKVKKAMEKKGIKYTTISRRPKAWSKFW